MQEDLNCSECDDCKKKFQGKEPVAVLRCEHIFHAKCLTKTIDPEIEENIQKCPSCSQEIFSKESSGILDISNNFGQIDLEGTPDYIVKFGWNFGQSGNIGKAEKQEVIEINSDNNILNENNNDAPQQNIEPAFKIQRE